MKIATYSDLHLEFGDGWNLPSDLDADILLLAGDIIVLGDFGPLKRFLQKWDKPVVFVPGNHEFYTWRNMSQCLDDFRQWLSTNLPQVIVLDDEAISFENVHIFGGAMWTDFHKRNIGSMESAKRNMIDYKRIIAPNGAKLAPADTIIFHEVFKKKLVDWFETTPEGIHIVITHHEPAWNPNSTHPRTPMSGAFTCGDMIGIIQKYQPDFWLYGHTHDHARYSIGKTMFISNPLGYPTGEHAWESKGFDPYGYMEVLHFDNSLPHKFSVSA